MNTTWYSCARLSGWAESAWTEKWNAVVPLSMSALNVVRSEPSDGWAMSSVRRKPFCAFAALPPGTKTDELSIVTEMTLSGAGQRGVDAVTEASRMVVYCVGD